MVEAKEFSDCSIFNTHRRTPLTALSYENRTVGAVAQSTAEFWQEYDAKKKK